MKRLHIKASVPMPRGPAPVAALRNTVRGALALLQAWPALWLLIAGATALFLTFGGGSFATSSRAVLHGLCAQRPTHSFMVGGELLPFDARMTGIYLGALWCWAVFAMRGRLLAAATPSWPVIVVLGLAVAVMGVDGFNALFVDLGRWHPYEPHNAIRFFTGFGAGVAIASLQVWLIGGALWNMGRRDMPAWNHVRQLWWTVPVSTVTFAVIANADAWLYPVIASLLMLSAWITVTGLMLVIVVSLLRIETRIVSPARLQWPLVISAAAALGLMIGLAQGRFWLERTLGIPQDFVAMSAAPYLSILLAGLRL